MKYKIKQKFFSFGDDFTIKDENDEDRFIVTGKVFSIGSKLKVNDLTGNELVNIEQKVLRLLPEYNLYASEEHLATVKKEFTFLKPRFTIMSTQGDYQISGNFIGYEFEILKEDKVVVTVSKKFLALADTYMVEINNQENQAFMLALVIVIDQVLHNSKNS